MKIKYIILVLVLVILALPMAVQAQSDQTNPQRLEREKRISERISRVKPDLSDEQKTNYKARCKGAQSKVAAHLENAKRFSEKQDTKFRELIERVNKLTNNLKSSGRDVAALETSLNNAIETNKKIKLAYESYILALTDTTELDCQVDPAGFRASIDEAKQEFSELIELRREVRKSIKQDLRIALQSILNAN